MARPTHTIAADTIIFNRKGEVLLVHRRDDYDMWCIPGGGVESGESTVKAAQREILEETGLEVEVYGPVGVYEKPQVKDIVFVYMGKIISGRLKPTSEADKFKYFSVNELPENMSAKQKERLKRIVKARGKIDFKVQPQKSENNKYRYK